MKNLIFLNGTMGVGKTAVCEQLYRLLPDAVWLDGDWCWRMHPWRVTDENKQMVEDNIVHLLDSFLSNSGFQQVLFCWVMHREEIAERLLGRLRDKHAFALHRFTLICSEEALRERLQRRETPEQFPHAAARLPLFRRQRTQLVDTTAREPGQVAQLLARRIMEGGSR